MFEKKLPWLNFCLVLIFCTASNGPQHAAAQSSRLNWKFNSGETFQQSLKQTIKMSADVNGQMNSSTVDQTIDSTMNIKSVDDRGTATIDHKFTRVQMTVNAPGVPKMVIDSDNDDAPANPLARGVSGLAQAQFLYKMTNSGEIKDVEVTEETMQRFQAIPGIQQLGEMFSKKSLTQMITQSGTNFPDKELKKGDTWNKNTEIKMPGLGKMLGNSVMTYAGPVSRNGNKLHQIDVDVKLEVEKDPNAQANLDITNQKASGKLMFDNETGMLVSSDIIQNFEMEISIAGQVIKQTMEQSMIMSMTK